MNNPLPIINLTDFALSLQSNKTVSGIIENFPDSLGSLNINDVLTLEFIQAVDVTSSRPAKVQVSLNNQKFELPLKIKLNASLTVENGKEPVAFQIRVTSNQPGKIGFELLNVNNRRPQEFLRQPVSSPAAETTAPLVESAVSSKLPLNLAPLKAQTVVEHLAGELKLPDAGIKELLPLLKNVEVSFSAPKVTAVSDELPFVKEVIGNLKTALSDISLKGENVNLPQVAEKIVAELSRLQNQPLPAKIMPQPSSPNVLIELPLGTVPASGRPDLPQPVLAEVLIEAVNAKPVEVTLKDLLNGKFWFEDEAFPVQTGRQSAASPLSALRSPGDELLSVLNLFRQVPETKPLISNILTKIPNPENKDFIANLVSFVKASKHQDVSLWLGKEAAEVLARPAADGEIAATRLNQFLLSGNREIAGWRMVEIPVLAGEALSHIRVAVKKNEEDDADKNKKLKQNINGVRFVIDTSFTKLGKIQLDGLSFESKRRFDLIIRSEKTLQNDIVSHIMNLFKNTLHSLDYVGTIKVNLKENFVRPWDEGRTETSSGRGILA